MKRYIVYGISVIFLAVFLFQKRNEVMGIVMVLLFAGLFSILLTPLCSKLEKKGMRPQAAAAYAVVGLALLVLFVLAAFVPYLVSHSVALMKRISPSMTILAQQIGDWVESVGLGQMGFTERGGLITSTVGQITGMLARAGMTFATQTGKIVFSFVLAYYILGDRKAIGKHMLLLVPYPWRRAVLLGIRGCANAVMSYFSGLIKTSVFVSLATGIGLIFLGVQDAFLLSVFMGVFEMLPYLGPILASIPILLSSMSQGIEAAGGTLIWLVVVQQIEGSFISPYFTASSTSIHPLAAVAGVFILGTLFGIWGILFAIPSMVLAQSILWSVRQSVYLMKDMHAQKSFAY